MDTAVETLSAVPPLPPPPPEPELPPLPPLLPIPIIKPSLIIETPPGNEPSTVKPGVPVLLEDMYIPEPMVATKADEPFHPAAVANVPKFPFVVSEEIVKANCCASLPIKVN
jgi:hypothetical protein